MQNKILKFTDGFLWGAATSAHQVEGGNKNDWSEWEKKNAKRLAREAKTKRASWQKEKFPEMFDPQNYISSRACDHYRRYEEDLDIAQSLNLNAFRISLEWSRIEPREGKFDEKEIEHYRKVLKAIRARGMEPFVTLCHYTLPLWLADLGGEKNKNFPEYFSRYATFTASKFKNMVVYWTTFNEPTVLIGFKYILGIWPPGNKDVLSAYKALKNIAKAHNKAFDEIHAISPNVKVGFTHLIRYFEPNNKNSFLDRLVVKIADYIRNNKLYYLTKNKNDYLALQYYFRSKLKFPISEKNENKEITDIGWEIYPEGIYHILINLKKYNLPIYITENGIADADDTKRKKFIKDHLQFVYAAIRHGVDVRGYFHWSLLDNFEWDKGFWPRFGLVEIDYKTMKRKIRPSAREYAKICKENNLEI
jgi:beta-glucosidase